MFVMPLLSLKSYLHLGSISSAMIGINMLSRTRTLPAMVSIVGNHIVHCNDDDVTKILSLSALLPAVYQKVVELDMECRIAILPNLWWDVVSTCCFVKTKDQLWLQSTLRG